MSPLAAPQFPCIPLPRPVSAGRGEVKQTLRSMPHSWDLLAGETPWEVGPSLGFPAAGPRRRDGSVVVSPASGTLARWQLGRHRPTHQPRPMFGIMDGWAGLEAGSGHLRSNTQPASQQVCVGFHLASCSPGWPPNHKTPPHLSSPPIICDRFTLHSYTPRPFL